MKLSGAKRVLLFCLSAAPFAVVMATLPAEGNVTWGLAALGSFLLAAIGLLLSNFL